MKIRPTWFSVVFSVVALICTTEGDEKIDFKLSARNLSEYDPFGGYPDPYVILTYENPPNPPISIGETSKLVDTQEADWPEMFNVIHISGSTAQKLTLDVYDEDIDSDDLMGSVVVRLDEIVSAFGGVLEREIRLDNTTVTGLLKITANITSDGLKSSM